MAILRKEKRGNFTVIDNAIFKDKELSYKAKGLLCTMLSVPDWWNFSIAGLTELSSDGESAVRSALAELKEAGYFRREQVRENGKITKIEYVVSETKNCENLVVGFPQQENLKQENHRQLNTNNNKRPTSIKNKDIYNEFALLWEMYPRKEGQKNAYKAYEKARKSGTTYEEVETGIRLYLCYIEDNKIERRFIKMGSTWFNQNSWTDQYVNEEDDLLKRIV